jgi:pimeloyl-ACP methyl ester carboxylesterase
VDIPILYMTGDYDFILTPDEVENLRKYLNAGGTILFNAARGMEEFSAAVAREMRKVFPQKQFMRLPPDHPAFNARYRVHQLQTLVNGVQFQQAPEIYSMDIGTRAAAILVPLGLGAAWSGEKYHPSGKHILGETALRLGVNLVAYVLGSSEYGRFLAQKFPDYAGQSRAGDVFRYATVVYRGSWDLHPGLHNSVALGLNDNTKIDVDYTAHRVALDEPQLFDYPLLFMTGHYDFEFSPKEVEGLRRYIERGGLLVASAGAGLKPFDAAFRREIKKVLPGGEFIKLPPTHPLFAAGWNSVDRVSYTSAALREDPSLEHPDFHCLLIDQRPAILYSPFDFLSGLNRESNAYAKGLDSTDALRVALNVITYALSH